MLHCRSKGSLSGRALQYTDQTSTYMLRWATQHPFAVLGLIVFGDCDTLLGCLCFDAKGSDLMQVIDDAIGNTLCATSTLSPDIREQLNGKLGADKVSCSFNSQSVQLFVFSQHLEFLRKSFGESIVCLHQ